MLTDAVKEAINHIRVRLNKLETQETATSSIVIEQARASSNLVLTTTPTDIPGCTLTLAPGTYLVSGVFDVDGGTDQDGDAFAFFFGYLDNAGVDESGVAHSNLAWQATRGAPAWMKAFWTVSQQWVVVLTSPTTILKLQGQKAGVFSSGNSQVNSTNTVLTAIGLLD